MNNFNQQGYFAPTNNARATNNIIWVQGIEGAKAWQLAPNSMAILLDSESDGKMYIKVTDNIGMASLRIFNYVEEIVHPAQGNVTTNNSLDLSQYVKKDELSTLIKEIINEQPVSTVGVSEPVKPGVITIKK
jgi:hypothetical protein